MAFALLKEKSHIILANITKLRVDAIVNAANKSLAGGGGVDGAIHQAAGVELYEACKMLGGCKTGEAKITSAFNIKNAKSIIHVVGPIISNDVTEEDCFLLAACYRNALSLAAKYNHRSIVIFLCYLKGDIIAFPCISTGVYSFPQRKAAQIAIDTVSKWLNENPDSMDEIIFCVFLESDQEIYNELFKDVQH